MGCRGGVGIGGVGGVVPAINGVGLGFRGGIGMGTRGGMGFGGVGKPAMNGVGPGRGGMGNGLGTGGPGGPGGPGCGVVTTGIAPTYDGVAA